jgi:hypothetical protein
MLMLGAANVTLAVDVPAGNLVASNLATNSSIGWNLIATDKFGDLRVRVQTTTRDGPPLAYFLEQIPDSIDGSTLPKTARDVVVARVRIVGHAAYLVGRDQSGRPPPGPPPKNLFSVRLKVLEVRSSDATVGATLEATFGVRQSNRSRTHHPHTPNQLDRDYFVVMYVDDDSQRRLAGFPISEAQYQEWETEVRDFERTRGKPGAPR